jgi:hypothetical protein
MSRTRITLIVVATLVLVAGSGAWLWAQAPGPQPTFGQLIASPPNFVFNTPTTVTFTTRIDTPTVNPTTVELLRVDATGNLLSRVGRMNDNGKGGDAISDDRVFTIRVALNEPGIGKVYFRVTASFRGNTQNTLSSLIAVDVDPFRLPPDPGEAGKQTLVGIDLDKDGVRDDVQRWIGIQYVDSPAVRHSLAKYAQSAQRFLDGYVRSGPSLTTAKDVISAATCLVYIAESSRIVPLADSVIFDTEERIDASLTTWRFVHELPDPIPAGQLASTCAASEH